MEFLNELFRLLFSPGNGFIFPWTILDLAVFLPLAFIIQHYLSKFFNLLKTVAVLDKMSGFTVISSYYSKPHWFMGHTIQYKPDHEGMMLASKRTADFPGLFSSHIAPGQAFLHVSHPETMAPVFASSAPKDDLVYGFLAPWIGNGLLRSSGHYWQRHRRLITPAFHFSILKSYIPTFNACAREMLNEFDSVKDQPIEVLEPIGLLTLDAMLQCAMSTTTHCQRLKNHPYVEAIHVLSSIVVKRSDTVYMLFDWMFKLTPTGRAFAKALKVAHSFTEKIITDRRNELESAASISTSSDEELNYRGGKLLNFLDILLTAKDEDGVGLTDHEIREEVDTFLFEGHDTTASGIAWAMYALAKHPEYQARCRDEVLKVVGNKEDVEWIDLSKLEYLTMFIKESLRLYPPVPITLRQLEEDLAIPSRYNISGESVPKGSYVCMNLWCLQRNRHIWDRPDVFDPERFSKENLPKMSFNTFLPFSAGSRNCIGQNFALNEIKVVLAQTLRQFHLSIDDSSPAPRLAIRLVLTSDTGIHIKFERYHRV